MPQSAPAALAKSVLVIVLDDVGTDKLALFDPGQPAPPYPLTPRLDALAASGIRFTSVYAHPFCSPTRASIQTGRYPLANGMGGNSEGYPLPDSEVTIAEVLKLGFPHLAAYWTGAFGKWHLTPSAVPNPDWEGHAVRNRYDRFRGTLSNTVDHFNWSKVEQDRGSSPTTLSISNRWSADVVREDVVAWIKSLSLTHPFFAYVAFNPPHASYQVPAFQTADGRELLSPATRTALGSAQPGDVPNNAIARNLYYRAAIEAIDSEIGYLLDDLGPQLGNTMIFVVGDNGTPNGVINSPHNTNHGKGSFYQHGIHVPMIVAGPLVRQPPPGGHVCEGLVDTVDLWSTIHEISGAKLDPAPTVHGVSFLPMIRNPAAASARPWSFSQLFTPAGPYTSVADLANHGRSITDGTWKYIRGVQGHTPGDTNIQYTHELYRLSDDPEETTDFFVAGMTPESTAAFDFLSQAMNDLSELGA